MKEHLIDKKTTNVIKGIAILIVSLGHYARFKEPPISFLSHTPYFGATLFAFLSGYGTMISYTDNPGRKWRGWILARIKRVYLPFVLVNTIGLAVYGCNDIGAQIFLGIHDSIMWYPLFILGFYALFALTFGVFKKKKLTALWICEIIIYILLAITGVVDSQWYTLIPSLLVGVTLALNEEKINSRYMLPALGILMGVFAILSLKSTGCIKYIFTSISGVAFSIFIFIIVRWICSVWRSFEIMHVIGNYSYFVYLVHMKIFDQINASLGTRRWESFLAFAVTTVAASVILQNIYCLTIKKWGGG